MNNEIPGGKVENQAPNKLTKKAARLQVNQALTSLTALESSLGKKKFRRRIEKVAKLLSQGLPKEKKAKEEKKDKTLEAA